jgi:recombination associated protein RdgC
VPAQALKEAVDIKCFVIEDATGRKPGKKERRDLKDEALIDLLPRAFPKRTAINVWIRPKERQLVIGTDSQNKVDEVINSLVRVAGQGFTVEPLQTKVAPQAAMTQWLAENYDPPSSLDILSSGIFKGASEEPEKVRFENMGLLYSFSAAQIERGNLPIRLSLNHADRVNFDLTDKLTFKSIKLVDIEPDPTAEEADRFDLECALWTGSLAPVIDSVVQALGGEA